MNVGGIRVGGLSEPETERILRQARAADPTYDHVGSTLDPQRWSRPGVSARRLDVGRGGDAFAWARTALQTWVPQRAIGAQIVPGDLPVGLGVTVLLVLRSGPFWVVVPNRVVAVVDEPHRYAFAYGTLPGHPERGEESFTVERLADDTVRATIRVQAGPGTLAARAAAPLVRQLQSTALRRYLEAIAEHVAMHERAGGP